MSTVSTPTISTPTPTISTPTPTISTPKATTKPIYSSICQILPFSDGTVFTSNKINMSSKNNNNCNISGNYIVSSSSYLNNKTMPYNVFNPTINGNDSIYWKCNDIENMLKGTILDIWKKRIYEYIYESLW